MNTLCQVLYVDDESDILDLVKINFSTHGVAVLTVNSAEEALRVFSQHPIKIVISDLRMPGMKGPQFYQELKRQFDFKGQFFLTSGNFEQRDLQGFPPEVGTVITKPVDYDELAQTVREQLLQLP